MPVKTILVVDDDFSMRKGLALLLRREGYRVREAATGAEALAILDKGEIDLIILDLFLPDEDGLEISDKIMQGGHSAKILLLTAHAQLPRAVEAKEKFGDRFMEKDSLGEVLPGKVRTILKG